MENDSFFVKFMGGHPMFRIVDFLIEERPEDWSKNEIAERTGLSRATVFTHFSDLEKRGIVKVTRSVGKTKMYRLDQETPMTKEIMRFAEAITDMHVNEILNEKTEAKMAAGSV